MVKDNKPRKIRLSANPTAAALADLHIGDIVYLDGTVYTAREGVYKRVLEDGIVMPMDLPADSAANFHCSPAATQHDDGSFDLGAVTATIMTANVAHSIIPNQRRAVAMLIKEETPPAI